MVFSAPVVAAFMVISAVSASPLVMSPRIQAGDQPAECDAVKCAYGLGKPGISCVTALVKDHALKIIPDATCLKDIVSSLIDVPDSCHGCLDELKEKIEDIPDIIENKFSDAFHDIFGKK